MSETKWCVVVIILAAAVAGLIFYIGAASGIDLCRKRAIEAGVAEYVADPKTGAVSFVYKECDR